MTRVFVTGAAGFIGYHLCRRLLDDGAVVYGLDNLNNYYDPSLKQARLNALAPYKNFTFQKADLADHDAIDRVFRDFKPDVVVNLAAQAGVRYSIENPRAYMGSNIDGFLNILEGCRHYGIGHLVFASSSSVYGANEKTPFAVGDSVDHPVSLYAATKKANELMAHTYAHLYGVPCTGLRFFTVYGPFGRPDMAAFKFIRAMSEGKPIDVYNNGDMLRDFTYIDDIIEGVVRVMAKPATPNPEWSGMNPDPASSRAPYRLYNIGNNNPVQLSDMIAMMERITGKTAIRNMLPMQPGDVYATYADTDALMRDVGFKPSTDLETGLTRFVEWYRDYYQAGAKALRADGTA